jgi:hypothetical protein
MFRNIILIPVFYNKQYTQKQFLYTFQYHKPTSFINCVSKTPSIALNQMLNMKSEFTNVGYTIWIFSKIVPAPQIDLRT